MSLNKTSVNPTSVRSAHRTFAPFVLIASGVLVHGQATLSVTSFGATADAIMRNDGAMTVGSATLTSASGTFNSDSIGKYIQVIGAGPGGTTRSDGVMPAGSATLTSSSGTFAATDIGRGIIVLGAGPAGGNLITTIAAFTTSKSILLNAPATSPVTAAPFFYGAMTLEATIQSVQSATSVTLSNAAASTITAAAYAYGTDNHVAFQSAVDSAGQAGGGTISVPQPASCPASAVCGYALRASDQMTARYPSAVKIRYNNVSLVGAAPQTNLFCRGAWSNYFNSAQFPGQTAAMRGDCILIGDNGGPNGKAGQAVSNVTVANLHLYGMTNGNTYAVSFDPTTAPLLTTGDGWDITHKGIHLWDNSTFSNITINSVVIQDFKGENIYGGGSIMTGIVISNSTLMNYNGDGISMMAASLQVLNNTITNGSNAAVESSTKSATSLALVSQVYQGNNISFMAREGINIVGVDSGISTGSVQIIGNNFNTIGQIHGSGAQAAVFVNPQALGDFGPSNVTVSNNTCVDCFSFGNLQTSGTTLVTGNSFIVDAYACSNFLSFTFPQTNVTISGNTGSRTANAIANSHMLSSVYMLDPGYMSGNFNWSNVVIENNLWNFPGIPNYTFVTTSGLGFQILTGHNITWRGDTCSGCTYPDANHGYVNLAQQSTIEPLGPVVYVGGNTVPVRASLDASKEQDGSLLTIVNAGASTVSFASDTNLSLPTPVTLPGGSMSSATFMYSAAIGKFVSNSLPLLISLSVSPATGSLSANQSLQFGATVSGTVNTAVRWQLAAGGAGAISASGLYTAPASIPAQQTVTVQAVSAADGTRIANAVVTLLPAVAVLVTPQTVSLAAGQTQQLTATVTGAGNSSVTWQVAAGGAGSISAAGFYSAPVQVSTQQTVTITATSAADNTKTAYASVTLVPSVGISVTPATASLGASQAVQLTGTVTGASNTAVTWQILNGAPGIVSASGLYTAPAAIATSQVISVQATSMANPTKTAAALITLSPTVGITTAPSSTSLSAGQTQQFTAVVSGTTYTAVTWQIAAGGAGTISASGLYTAPAIVLTAQTVSVLATSSANSAKFATSSVTLMPAAAPALGRVGTPAVCALGGNTNSGSCAYNATAGNFLVVTCSSQATQTGFRIIDTKGNAYLQDGFSSRGVTTSIFHASNVAGGAVNPTCMASTQAGNGLVITVTEYAGLPASAALDGTPSNSAGTGGGNADSGAVYSTGGNEVLVGVAISNAVPNCNGTLVGSGWTQLQFQNNQQNYCMVLADQLIVGAGAYHFATAFTNSTSWAAILAGFK